MAPSVLHLSTHECASHVVQKCFQSCSKESDRELLISSMVSSDIPDAPGGDPLHKVATDKNGAAVLKLVRKPWVQKLPFLESGIVHKMAAFETEMS